MPKKKALSFFGIIKALFKKYHRDHGNIMVSSISFYVLLTFIPFTLFSICVVGYIVDLKNPARQLETFVRSAIPAPYDTVIVKKILSELNIISVTKRLSGPLGLAFLFFFTTRLFAVIRPSFHLIFGQKTKSFLKRKWEEMLMTLLFTALQTFLFFGFVGSVMLQAKFVKALGGIMTRTPIVHLFSFFVTCVVFTFFYLLYYFLTPVRDKKLLLMSTIPGVVLWYGGKYFFKYFILTLGKYTAFFGAYGAFIAFLLWVYFSAFVFVVCAELLSVLSDSHNHERPAGYGFSGK
ncbi:MAG TPA: YihY/virulence factor BrkB family protein [Syntrophorhabdaceae bacterium]|nr:YihY/virulence factor BrkB family protein [Syntrophorhabdaceae bacterium]